SFFYYRKGNCYSSSPEICTIILAENLYNYFGRNSVCYSPPAICFPLAPTFFIKVLPSYVYSFFKKIFSMATSAVHEKVDVDEPVSGHLPGTRCSATKTCSLNVILEERVRRLVQTTGVSKSESELTSTFRKSRFLEVDFRPGDFAVFLTDRLIWRSGSAPRIDVEGCGGAGVA
ncbi:hypothetical protein LINGRAHAP2_LOCUS7541, partial [Linum grandiflorum]